MLLMIQLAFLILLGGQRLSSHPSLAIVGATVLDDGAVHQTVVELQQGSSALLSIVDAIR